MLFVLPPMKPAAVEAQLGHARSLGHLLPYKEAPSRPKKRCVVMRQKSCEGTPQLVVRRRRGETGGLIVDGLIWLIKLSSMHDYELGW